MVDRRKMLHRRARELSRAYPDVFLAGLVPYASIVEQMSVRRLPLAAFAPCDAAATAFAEIWTEFESRLKTRRPEGSAPQDRWEVRRRAVESVLAQLEASDAEERMAISHRASVIDLRVHSRGPVLRDDRGSMPVAATYVVHRFDTDTRDLEQRGHAIELHERPGGWLLVTNGAQARIDRLWACEILSGLWSPLAALEQRLGRDASPQFESVRALVGGRRLQRIESMLREVGRPSVHSPSARMERLRDSAGVEAV
jgi:hypothetical protein